jgi:hypothetical protein
MKKALLAALLVEGPWWDHRACPIVGRKIVAVAIRYRGEREPA